MKIRKGFVTNSSSSSFICLICGASEVGRDYSPADVYMLSCTEHNHTFCEEHLRDYAGMGLEEYDPNEADEYGDRSYGYIRSSQCPICNMLIVTDDMVLKYLKHSGELDSIKQEIKNRYTKYSEFLNNPSK